MVHEKYPHGWGDDNLSRFQHTAFANELWSYVNDFAFNNLLTECDSFIFESLLKAAPKNRENASIGVLLFISSHNHYRASARLCLSGQYLPVYPIARACVENAVYGWLLTTNPKLEEIWLNKPKKTDMKAIKDWNHTFSFSRITKLIGQQDKVLERLLKQNYQTAIDFGAHPNKAALSSNLIRRNEEGVDLFSLGYLHSQGKIIPYTSSFMLEISLSLLVLIRQAYPAIANEGDFYLKWNALAEKVGTFQDKAHAEIEGLRQGETVE